MPSKMISTLVATVAVSLTAAMLQGNPILAGEHVRCGIEFESDHYHLAHGTDGPGSMTIERRFETLDGRATPIVMHFDEPVDSIDFLVRHGEHGSLQATLVALDADGRLVDTDSGWVSADALSTMQVTADSAVIREARFAIEGSPAIGYIVDLEVGSSLSFCAARG